MDLEQLQKRLQWVEDEWRKEKDSITLLENRLATLEGGLSGVSEQVKEVSGEITRLAALTTRMNQYDQSLLQIRTENKQQLDELDKTFKLRNEETEKVRRVETKALENDLLVIRTSLESLQKIEKSLQARIEEETRLQRMIEDLRNKTDQVRREEEEYTRTLRLLEDGRRQDSKRLTELQGEVAALRKRADEQRGQAELMSTNLSKVENRINELTIVETERRDAMTSFLDKQALTQVERDRVWKDWQTRFETIERQASDIESQLLKLDTTHRETKRAQAALEDLTQRVERRINEITEIQRLAEDRFRQEWVTFKADDQKRWTNYILTQEEQRGEALRQSEKLAEQVTHLGDELQEVKDLLQQANEQAERRLQALLAMTHDWVSTYERTVGRSR